MKTIQFVFFILVVLTFAASCKFNSNQEESLVFEERVFNMESQSCKTDSMRCASINTTYPIATKGKPEVITAINDSIMRYVQMSIAPFAESPEAVKGSLEESAAMFIGEYEYLTSEETEYITPWALDTESKVLYQSPKYVTIELTNYSFTGGAHPNYYTEYLNFNADTGVKIEPVDMVADVKQLMVLAEAKFKEARELSESTNLIEEGFFWEGVFVLPQNIAITEEGLLFYYNPYEVAAYALGPTEFTITYEELGSLWKG